MTKPNQVERHFEFRSLTTKDDEVLDLEKLNASGYAELSDYIGQEMVRGFLVGAKDISTEWPPYRVEKGELVKPLILRWTW